MIPVHCHAFLVLHVHTDTKEFRHKEACRKLTWETGNISILYLSGDWKHLHPLPVRRLETSPSFTYQETGNISILYLSGDWKHLHPLPVRRLETSPSFTYLGTGNISVLYLSGDWEHLHPLPVRRLETSPPFTCQECSK